MNLRVNGGEYEVEASAGRSLASVLRDDLGLPGTKVACGEGHCGACTVQLDGVPIPRGEKIAVLFGAANRDPRVFASPDTFDVGRPNAGEHISFGGGIHVCIGAPLARIELDASLRALVDRCPNLELAEEPQRIPAFVIWGLERLDLTVG